MTIDLKRIQKKISTTKDEQHDANILNFKNVYILLFFSFYFEGYKDTSAELQGF